MTKYMVPFLIAFMVTYLMTPLVRYIAISMGFYDAPDARKVHTGNIPRLGGVAIFLGYITALLYSLPLDNEKWGLVIGTLVLVAIGLWDDIKEIGPKTKLLGQIVAAGILVFSGVSIEWITNPWGTLIFLPEWISIPLTIFWIVAFINIVNLIDGLDGLAAGICLISCATIFGVTFVMGQSDTAFIIVSLAGAIFAFLKYNFNPAKIFMGDTGSMLLGYTLGAVSVVGVVKTATTVALLVPVIVLGVPIMDTTFAIVRRFMNGRPIFKPDKGHLHHRLLAMGLTQKQAVLLMYAATIAFGGIALIVANFNSTLGIILLLSLIVCAVYVANRLGTLGNKSYKD